MDSDLTIFPKLTTLSLLLPESKLMVSKLKSSSGNLCGLSGLVSARPKRRVGRGVRGRSTSSARESDLVSLPETDGEVARSSTG